MNPYYLIKKYKDKAAKNRTYFVIFPGWISESGVPVAVEFRKFYGHFESLENEIAPGGSIIELIQPNRRRLYHILSDFYGLLPVYLEQMEVDPTSFLLDMYHHYKNKSEIPIDDPERDQRARGENGWEYEKVKELKGKRAKSIYAIRFRDLKIGARFRFEDETPVSMRVCMKCGPQSFETHNWTDDGIKGHRWLGILEYWCIPVN